MMCFSMGCVVKSGGLMTCSLGCVVKSGGFWVINDGSLWLCVKSGGLMMCFSMGCV